MFRRLLILFAMTLLLPTVAAHHPEGLHEPPTDQFVYRVGDIEEAFLAWEAQHPEFVDYSVIGRTGILDLPVHSARITDESIAFDAAATATGQKIRIYIDGGHHGNEYMGTDLPMYYLESMVRSIDTDQALRAWLQTHEIYAVPLVNAEGNSLDTRKNANQVDPNRNYPFAFGGVGSGANPTDLNYRGPAALSEPETRANAEYAQSLMPDLWITGHSGISQFLYPWGWVTDRSPDDAFFLAMETTFEAKTNGRIDMLMSADLYPAGGATDDWGYGQFGIATHTYEVHDDQFIPAYNEGVPAEIADQLNGLDWVVKNARVWGAWISLHAKDDGIHVWNEGWAKAGNVTLLINGREVLIPEMAPDEMIVFPAEAGTWQASYKQMLVDAPEAKTRLVALEVGPDAAALGNQDSPALGLLIVLGVVLVAARRRN